MKLYRKLLALVLCCAMVLSVSALAAEPETDQTEEAAPVTDVAEDAWYADAVDFVRENGYMNGYADGTFGPERTVTRGHLYQTLYQMQGSPEVEASGFTDVAEDAWYAGAAAWAEDKGLATGETFRADTPVTRQVLAKVLVTYAELTGRAIRGRGPEGRHRRRRRLRRDGGVCGRGHGQRIHERLCRWLLPSRRDPHPGPACPDADELLQPGRVL